MLILLRLKYSKINKIINQIEQNSQEYIKIYEELPEIKKSTFTEKVKRMLPMKMLEIFYMKMINQMITK